MVNIRCRKPAGSSSIERIIGRRYHGAVSSSARSVGAIVSRHRLVVARLGDLDPHPAGPGDRAGIADRHLVGHRRRDHEVDHADDQVHAHRRQIVRTAAFEVFARQKSRPRQAANGLHDAAVVSRQLVPRVARQLAHGRVRRHRTLPAGRAERTVKRGAAIQTAPRVSEFGHAVTLLRHRVGAIEDDDLIAGDDGQVAAVGRHGVFTAAHDLAVLGRHGVERVRAAPRARSAT